MKVKDIFSRPKVICVVGDVNCMPKGTRVKTEDGIKNIEDVSDVLSYNFESKKIESKKCNSFNAGMKKVFVIKIKGCVMKCSGGHRWFVKRNGEVAVVKTKDIIKGDILLKP